VDWRSALREDLARLASRGELLSIVTLTLFRLNQGVSDRRFGSLRFLLLPFVRVAKFVWVEFLMSAQLPRATQIGPGLRIPHGGRGVMIHPHTRIGRNATIFEWASIGVIEQLDDRGKALAAELVPPVIGDDVYIGCGASIFGPVHIGDRSRIGIGAVVFRDVPADSTVSPPPQECAPAHPRVRPRGAGVG
jgi:serine acetyltransferase